MQLLKVGTSAPRVNSTQRGAKLGEADFSERRNTEAIRRLRWELCGRLDVA
jgi:hypothetical protein